jgi:hypothetical protein
MISGPRSVLPDADPNFITTAIASLPSRACGTGIWPDRDIYHRKPRCCRALRVSADCAARPGPHTRGKPWLLGVGRRETGLHRTPRWREPDSNCRSLPATSALAGLSRIRGDACRASDCHISCGGTASSNPVSSSAESVLTGAVREHGSLGSVSPSGGPRPEEPVTSTPFYHRTHPAVWRRQDAAAPRDQVGRKDPQPLSPAVSFDIATIASLGLWWGIWESASFFLSAVL